jgi:hypothetical protein
MYMLRSTLIVAGGVLLSSAGIAQQRVDRSGIRPLTATPRYAGTYNYAAKKWMPAQKAAQLQASSLTVYNNTCTFTGAAYYFFTTSCETYFDEGRIPGGIGGNNPPGATVDNAINFFEMQYCTNALTGTVDIEVGFYDNFSGGCLGGITRNPPALSTQAQGWFDFGAAAGFPLPGSATGVNTCWIVGINVGNGGFCMQSDGDGVFDNVLNTDQFSWSFAMRNPGSVQGWVLSGEPVTSPVGGCTYNIPCGVDFWYSVACGSGLDTEDLWWINTDGDAAGGGLGGSCPTAFAATGCYWFGGYPGGPGYTNPIASYYMKMGSSGSCTGCTGNATTYCTSGTTSHGCVGVMSMSGVPSPRNAAPCTISASNIENNQQGIIFYGTQQLALPWSGTSTSFLCVKALERTGNQSTTQVGGFCAGAMSVDINGYWAANPGAAGQPVFAGQVLNFQGWFRDPPAPKTTNLTNGLQITLCP